jgi:serine/threonine protein kinase
LHDLLSLLERSMAMLSTPVIRGVEDIGPYQVLEDLGTAPFGTLYLAVDTRTDRKAMLKVIPPSRPGVLQETVPWEILLAETQSLFRIYHRGLPTLFEVGELDGFLLVAFAPVEGATLHELLARGERPDRALLVDWGCQLLDILSEAHGEGLVHRHVGEDQIVVAPDGHLVLTGFGLTQLFFEPLTAFPAEQLLSEPFTPQADLYAVGLLLRRLAFTSGLKGGGGSGAHRDPLLKVLARATFPDPAARFQDAAEMADALRQAGRSPGASSPLGVPDSLSPAPMRSDATIRAVRGPVPVPPPPAVLPARAGSPKLKEDEDRRFALLLVAAALLLMLTVIAAGWFLIGRSGRAVSPSTPSGATSNFSRAPQAPESNRLNFRDAAVPFRTPHPIPGRRPSARGGRSAPAPRPPAA